MLIVNYLFELFVDYRFYLINQMRKEKKRIFFIINNFILFFF